MNKQKRRTQINAYWFYPAFIVVNAAFITTLVFIEIGHYGQLYDHVIASALLLINAALTFAYCHEGRSALKKIPPIAFWFALIYAGAGIALGGVEFRLFLLEPIYRIAQLFVGESAWIDSALAKDRPYPWASLVTLNLARMAALLATVSGLLAVVRRLTDWARVSVRPWKWHDHTVLCGLGEAGMEFVKLLYEDDSSEALDRRKKLLIIEHDESNQNVETARNLGAAVLIGDVFSKDVQARARLAKANTVIMMLSDDKRNIELALETRELVRAARESAKETKKRDVRGRKGGIAREAETTKLLIHVDDTRLARRIQDHSRAGIDQYTETRFFDFYESSARALFEKHPLDHYADIQKSETVHLAIYGFGKMGEAVLRQAVRLACFPGGRRLCITIFDRRAGEKEFVAGFWRANPGLKNLQEGDQGYKPIPFSVRFLELVDARWGIKEEKLNKLCTESVSPRRQSGPMPPPTQHVICFDQDSLGASFAMSLRDAFRERDPDGNPGNSYSWDAPIFVRLKRRHGLARLFLQSGSKLEGGSDALVETPDSLFAFGMLDDIVDTSQLIGARRDGLAKILHEDGYRKLRRIHGAQADANIWRKQTKVPWQSLALHFKNSSRAQADHIEVKLRSVGCTVSEPSMAPDESSLARPGAACFEPIDRIFRAGEEFVTVQRMGTVLPVVTRWKPSARTENVLYQADQTPQDLVALDADMEKYTATNAAGLPKSWQEAQRSIQALQSEFELSQLIGQIEPSSHHDSNNEISIRSPKEAGDGSELILLRGKNEIGKLLINGAGLKSPKILAFKVDWPWVAVLAQAQSDRTAQKSKEESDEEHRDTGFPSVLLWRFPGETWPAPLNVHSERRLPVRDCKQDATRLLLTKSADEALCALAVWIDAIPSAAADEEITANIDDGAGNYIFVINRSAQLRQIDVVFHSAVTTLAILDGIPDSAAEDSANDGLTLAVGCQDSDVLLLMLDLESMDLPETGATVTPFSTVQLAHPWMLHLRQTRVGNGCDDTPAVDRDAWEQLARTEHDRWATFNYLENWRYGKPRVDVARVHDNLLPWEKLKPGTRQYDATHVAKIPLFLDRLSRENEDGAGKTQLCREIRIGIVGHRPHRLKGRLSFLNHGLEQGGHSPSGKDLHHPEIERLIKSLSDTFAVGPTELPVKFVLVTCLAEGADRALARALLKHAGLNAKLQPVLPLPWEIYRNTFTTGSDPKGGSALRKESEDEFLEFLQDRKAAQHIQMPMLYGNTRKIADSETKDGEVSPQQKQFQLANAWIVQHCDYLIAAWDGKEIGGNPAVLSHKDLKNKVMELKNGENKTSYTKDARPGGTWEAVRWWLDPRLIAASMRWPSHLYPICANGGKASEDRLFLLGRDSVPGSTEPREWH